MLGLLPAREYRGSYASLFRAFFNRRALRLSGPTQHFWIDARTSFLPALPPSSLIAGDNTVEWWGIIRAFSGEHHTDGNDTETRHFRAGEWAVGDACVIRGLVDAPKCKDYIVPLASSSAHVRGWRPTGTCGQQQVSAMHFLSGRRTYE